MGLVSKETVVQRRWEVDKQDINNWGVANLNVTTVESLKNMSKHAHAHGFQSFQRFYCGKI